MLAKETYYKGKRDLLQGQKRPNQEAKETYYTGKRQTWADMAKHTRRRLGQMLPQIRLQIQIRLGQTLPLFVASGTVANVPRVLGFTGKTLPLFFFPPFFPLAASCGKLVVALWQMSHECSVLRHGEAHKTSARPNAATM